MLCLLLDFVKILWKLWHLKVVVLHTIYYFPHKGVFGVNLQPMYSRLSTCVRQWGSSSPAVWAWHIFFLELCCQAGLMGLVPWDWEFGVEGTVVCVCAVVCVLSWRVATYVCLSKGCSTHTHTLHSTWRNAQFGEKVIIQMEEKSKETAAELKQAIGETPLSLSLLSLSLTHIHTHTHTLIIGHILCCHSSLQNYILNTALF